MMLIGTKDPHLFLLAKGKMQVLRSDKQRRSSG
jgi:hypothetical protein